MRIKLSYIEAQMLIREFGIHSAKEYERFRSGSAQLKKSLPSQPSVFYKYNWEGWNEFTGVKPLQSSNFDIQQIQQIAIDMGIKTKEEWCLAVKTKQIDAPLFVSRVQGFSNWTQFLNLEKYASFDRLLSFTRAINIRTQTDWRQWCRDNEKPFNIPFDLYTHYNEDFKSLNLEPKISFWRYIFVGS